MGTRRHAEGKLSHLAPPPRARRTDPGPDQVLFVFRFRRKVDRRSAESCCCPEETSTASSSTASERRWMTSSCFLISVVILDRTETDGIKCKIYKTTLASVQQKVSIKVPAINPADRFTQVPRNNLRGSFRAQETSHSQTDDCGNLVLVLCWNRQRSQDGRFPSSCFSFHTSVADGTSGAAAWRGDGFNVIPRRYFNVKNSSVSHFLLGWTHIVLERLLLTSRGGGLSSLTNGSLSLQGHVEDQRLSK